MILYQFQESHKAKGSDILTPYGATFFVSAKSEGEARKMLPGVDVGVHWTLISKEK